MPVGGEKERIPRMSIELIGESGREIRKQIWEPNQYWYYVLGAHSLSVATLVVVSDEVNIGCSKVFIYT